MTFDAPWRLPPFWDDGAIKADRLDWAADTLREYFGQGPADEYWYSGARFERLAGGGDRPDTINTIAADDLVAVSMLGVTVPGHAAIRFLETEHVDLSHLLAAVPADVDLFSDEAEGAITSGGDADQLWSALRRRPGTGRTTTSKVLARKRPRLLPVYDSVVADLLGLPDTLDYWRGIRALLRSDERFVPFLCDARAAAEADDIALLRIFDILVWMSSPRRRPPR